jgi:phage baseplate assembly protein W
MNVPQYRGWRFDYPWVAVDPGANTEMGGTGLGINPTGGIAMVQGNDDVRQAILLLLSTVPGERVMRPEYGCLIHRLVFAPNDDTTAGLAIFYVRSALKKWEPRVDVLRVDANRSPEAPEWLDIVLEYRVRAIMQVQTVLFSFDLAGVGRL